MKRLYIEEASDIKKEFYLSCLVDRASSKIAFISSAEGGMDVEEVADKTPEKIITTRVSLSAKLKDEDLESIVKPYNLSGDQKNQAKKVAQALYDTLVNTVLFQTTLYSEVTASIQYEYNIPLNSGNNVLALDTTTLLLSINNTLLQEKVVVEAIKTNTNLIPGLL